MYISVRRNFSATVYTVSLRSAEVCIIIIADVGLEGCRVDDDGDGGGGKYKPKTKTKPSDPGSRFLLIRSSGAGSRRG